MLGEAANVSIADPDANENAAVMDSIRVFTSSSSATDQAGRVLSANETGNDTGAFRVAFRIVSHTVDDHDETTILANGNDKVVISYTDRHMLPIILTKSAVAKTLKRNSFLKSVSRSLTERRRLSLSTSPHSKRLLAHMLLTAMMGVICRQWQFLFRLPMPAAAKP
jgi:hypothetical protein